jgi:hypothetical protein
MRKLVLVSAFLVASFSAGAVAQTATTTTLAVTSGTSVVTTVVSGTVVTLTATVNAGTTPVTAGQVNFCDATAKSCTDIHLLGTAQLTKAGTAILRFRPGVGSHSFKAAFLGTPNGSLSTAASTSGAAALTVTGLYPTVTTIKQSGNAGDYTLTATVGGTGSAAPTGTVSFLNASDGSAVLGTAALTNGTAGLSFLYSPGFSLALTSTYVVASGFSASSIVVGDFNGDGIADIAAVDSAGCATLHCWDAEATVFLGDGQGNFTAAAILDLGTLTTDSIAAGDFNGDGILDLAVGSSDAQTDPGTVTTLLGKGDGTFTVGGSVATGGAFQSFVVGDFNGDGIPDLAVANSTADMVFLFLGNGDGTFTPSSAATSATGSGPTAIAVGDFNGDGKPDLAIANFSYPSGTLTILLGNGNGTFTTAASPATGGDPNSIAVGDFNGDGILDLAVANYADGTATILLGNGNGTFAPSSDSPVGPNQVGKIFAVGDFSGSAKADLVGIGGVLLGKGDGTFTEVQSAGINGILAVGDVNGDGLTDLIGAGAVWLTATETSTATVTGINVPVATGTQQVAASYPGDSNYETSISGAISLAATQGAPIVSLTASPNPATTGSPVTLTATVTGTGLTPTGTVTFYAGSVLLGSAVLNSNGVATFATSSLATGQDSVTASYGGDANYVAANAPAIVVSVTGLITPTVSVTPSSSSVTTAQALTVTVTVNGGSGNPTPTGSVTLASGSYTSAATTLSGGSATINVPAGSLATGSDTLTASYTPDSNSSATYNAATGSKSVAVTAATKTTPTITWATPAAIAYGTALSATQLDATASVAGSFSYSPALGTVLTAGSQTLTVNFTPTDTTDYTTAAASVTLTVNQATPIVTWATPAAIFSGTALTATQLDATASVPGTFVYTPALGAMPPVGNDTLSVTFTPTDSVDYSAVTSTVTLTVNVPLNPVPFVGNITPAIANAGGVAFTITVNGSGFLANSTVYWGTSALTTVFLSSTELTATVTAADIATPGATAITVQTPAPGGGMSDVLQFEVDSAAAAATAPTVPTAVVTVTAGSTATYSISFPASVTNATASCLNLPAGALCSFSFASGVLTISTSSTTPAGTYQVTVVFDETVSSTSSGFILLPLLLLPVYLLRRKLTRRGVWAAVGLSVMLAGAVAFSVGCGGSSSSSTTKTTTQAVTSSGVVGMAVH